MGEGRITGQRSFRAQCVETEGEMANVEFLRQQYLVLSAVSGQMARYHQRVDQSSGPRDVVTVAGDQQRVLSCCLMLGHTANIHSIFS